MHKIAIRILFLLFVMLGVSVPAFSQVAVGVSISFGPPAIPVYDQPPCPFDGYIWTPGYWAWDDDEDDYYWVPGTWVEPPEVGFFWTPGYWVWEGDGFIFHDGYWGPEVGFYGGINYGFGYFGEGFVGGRWDHDHFYYNRAVSNVNVTVIHNVYEERVTNVTVNRVSYNGGNGGVNARPTQQQLAFADQRHVAPVSAQVQHMQAARGNQDLRASANHGKPPIAATDRPGAFNGRVVKAKDAGAPYNPPPNRSAMNARSGNNTRAENNAANNTPRNMDSGRPANNGASNRVVHPNDMPAYERQPAPNTGSPKLDQKYQQQQQKLADQQNKERQKLQQQQEKEHQQYQKRQADEQRTQALEQKHEQQTQQLQQRQVQQQQNMQRRESPPPSHAATERAPAEHSAPAEPKQK